MHRGGPDDRLGGQRHARRAEDEWSGLRAAESAVEGDQLFERAALVERGVIEAADHDVGDVRESIRALQVPCRRRRERSQRIVAVDPTLVEVVGAGRAEDDRTVFGRANEQPADVGVLTHARKQLGVTLVDLLEREPSLFLHEIDESEVA